MESSRRSRRHRNPQAQEPQQAEHQPFFSKTAVGATIQTKPESAFFQAKLTIGQPDDQYEKEADSVADKVVNNTVPPAPKGSFGGVQKQEADAVQRLATPEEENMPATNDARMAEDKQIQEKPLQRAEKKEEEKPVQKAEKKEEEKPVQKAEKKEEEKPVQKAEKQEEEKPVQKADKKEEEKPVQKAEKKEEEKPVQKAEKKEEEKPVQKAEKKEEEKPVQRAPAKQEEAKGKGDVKKEPFETRLAHTKGKGKPLPDKIRAKMEAEMQRDFSSVRIHDDAAATALAEEIHAQAFTQGADIYFNQDKYNPETAGGAHLLAHELTHVVQQGMASTKE